MNDTLGVTSMLTVFSGYLYFLSSGGETGVVLVWTGVLFTLK